MDISIHQQERILNNLNSRIQFDIINVKSGYLPSKLTNMKVAVWDTYVKKENGTVMNFDIMVPDSQQNETIIYGYGREYLQSKSIIGYELTSSECAFCHVEQATEEMVQRIREKGYYILELRNCK